MNLFKKKHERSDWFEGLLEAEKLYADGYHYHKNDGIHIWFEKVEDGVVCQRGIPCNLYERVEGIKDYLEFIGGETK